MVVKRRRYDTVELVAEIRRERRNGIILALAGVGILIVLLGLYASGLGDEKVPTAPGTYEDGDVPVATPTEPTPPPVAGTGAETAAITPEEKPPEVKPPVEAAGGTAKLQIVLTKKSPLWINGKKIGKVKKYVVDLPPGQHEIKAKLGKKMVTQKFDPKPGKTYALRFDAKRKKATLKKK